MKKHIKIILALLLAFALLFLPSCSRIEAEGTIEPQTLPFEETILTETNESTEEEINPYAERIKSLPDADFGGATFRIATDTNDLVVNTAGASFVGKEQYLRNLAVEEKYNVKLTLTDESGLPTVVDRIRTEALAGAGFCDLVILHTSRFQDLVSADLLHNVRTVPYLNLSGEGIHSESLKATTFGPTTYGFAGDFIYEPDSLYGIFFNKDLLSKTALPDLYQLVRDNQWDFDNLVLYAEEVLSVSLAGGKRISGFQSTASKEELINVFWAAGGQDFLSNDYGTRPYLDYNNETTESFIGSVQKALFKTSAFNDSTASAVSTFSTGDSFMLIAPLSTAKDLVGKGINWGLVPLPKQDINQSNFYSYMSNNVNFAGFVFGTPDLNFSGMVTNALFESSVGIAKKIANATYLNLYFNSITDVEMMERMIDTPYYDPIVFFSTFDDSITASTQTLLFRAISSEGRFSILYNQYNKMFEKYLNEKF